MQMGEASEHRPGDYGRWESSLWSPWHRGSHFGGLVVSCLSWGGKKGWVRGKEEMKEERGGKNVSWYHSLTRRLTITPHPKIKKGEE